MLRNSASAAPASSPVPRSLCPSRGSACQPRRAAPDCRPDPAADVRSCSEAAPVRAPASAFPVPADVRPMCDFWLRQRPKPILPGFARERQAQSEDFKGFLQTRGLPRSEPGYDWPELLRKALPLARIPRAPTPKPVAWNSIIRRIPTIEFQVVGRTKAWCSCFRRESSRLSTISPRWFLIVTVMLTARTVGLAKATPVTNCPEWLKGNTKTSFFVDQLVVMLVDPERI
jgi:hypothetical protein